ncbi:hypothetical protein BBD41_03105 [Paenibacillus ihbetae]|uniref:Uncharacterized protein n=1 Tax=Paenibacillus ihbetae TaxID=1870820 RepID=A0A1B2DVA2_9BACL|nr:hypothetical protein BBD41_03105 [Paenibacillus ihbetae]
MARIQNKLMVELYPTVQDVCEVISAVGTYYQGQEVEYLSSIQRAITKRLEVISNHKETTKQEE